MSLINQMLKDLESRRTSGDLAQRAVDGMGAAARQKKKKQNVLLLSLLSLIVVLALISGYLLWQEKQAKAEQQASNTEVASIVPKADVAPAPAASPVKKAPASSASQPNQTLVRKPTTGIRETPAGMTFPESDEEEAPLSDEQPVVVERDAPPVKIRKQMRPQNNEQLAEQKYQRGYALLQQGDRKGAEDAWRAALRFDSKHTASRESLAILYLSQSRRIEAAEQLQKGLSAEPGNTKLALLYARMQLDAGDDSEAVATLEKAMQARQQNGDFYAFIAAIYQRMGDFKKSIAAYQAALKQQSNQSVWWMGLGISLEGVGKNKEALSAYTEAKKSGRLKLKLRQYVEGRISALE